VARERLAFPETRSAPSVPDRESFDPTFVPPHGTARPRLYIVGEAPGTSEVAQGRPFVGRAGKLLGRILAAADIDEREVRLFNAIPFRPIAHWESGARNRKPTAGEIRTYAVYLFDDIAETKPRSLVAAGTSALAAFGIKGSIEDARERTFALDGMPLRATYHPQFVGRFGGAGGALWNAAVRDFRAAWHAGGGA